MQGVPRLARACPHCNEPLQRISVGRVAYVLAGALAVLGLLASCAILISRLIQYSAE